MLKSAATLKRWIAATGGDLPYPSSPDQIGVDLGLRLQQTDPELFQIVSGAPIPASLELAVMDGTLADVAPSQQERADAATAARIEELTASNPFGQAGYYNEQGELVPPVAGNMTAAMELKSLNPALAAQLEAAAQPAAAQQGHQWTQGDLQVLARHGYAVPQS
jgi:hypothetical protein